MTEEEQARWESILQDTAVAELLNLSSKLRPGLSLPLLLPTHSHLGWSVGWCTHPDATDYLYMHSRGGKKLITDASVPLGFKWIGSLDRGVTEYLFAMWREGDRWFWFYQALLFSMNPSAEWASWDLARERFAIALDRWNSGQKAVIYSGYYGWYDPDTNKFELDPYVVEREDWGHFAGIAD